MRDLDGMVQRRDRARRPALRSAEAPPTTHPAPPSAVAPQIGVLAAICSGPTNGLANGHAAAITNFLEL